MTGVFRYAIRTGVLRGVKPIPAACIPKAKPGRKTYAYTPAQILRMLKILPLATKLHQLGVADIVIQGILRHNSDVRVTRAASIKNDAVDARSLAAMQTLESAVCCQNAAVAQCSSDRDAVN